MQAELVWASCGTELIHLAEAIQDLQSSNDQKPLLHHENIFKSLVLQDLQFKKTIFDCLSSKTITFPELGEENAPRKWYMEYLEYFSLEPNHARKTRKLAEANAPTPGPSPSPSPSPSPLPVAGPVIPNPPSLPFFPVIDPNSNRATQGPSGSGANQQSSNGNNDTHKKVIIAVVVTATTTFFLAALFFCFYTRRCGRRRGQNDERPLLSLSLSDYSNSGMFSFLCFVRQIVRKRNMLVVDKYFKQLAFENNI